MEQTLKALEAFGLKELWMIKEVAVLITTVFVHFIFAYIFKKVIRASRRTQSIWDDILVVSVRKPLRYAIWLVGISIALMIFGNHYQSDLVVHVSVLREAVIVICIAWFGWNFISEASSRYLIQQAEKDGDVDRTTVDALSKLGHLVVIIASVLTLMQSFGFSVSGLLAAGGIGGIAIGFAAKDILANFFGGLTIYADRPFVVGDWIRSPDKDIEGTVEKISWRFTQIRRFNKNPIYVPNSVFTTIAVENPSRMTNRRIKETVGIRYDDIKLMPAIVKDVKKMLQSHKDIDTTKTLIVNFNAFNASSVDFLIYTFSKTVVWEEFHAVKQDVLIKVANIIEKHGAEIAYPTQTLHIANHNPEDS
ncbi:MAG TPA: mechanosensitive ion channel family protein [Methylophilaceae bacterium]|nr:mechanosensitive ion channel family protein [Methylophilaceae bacterium]